MIDYDLFYRTPIDLANIDKGWDIFISAFNDSARVIDIYQRVEAENKFWLVFPEYSFSNDELPASDNTIILPHGRESEQLKYFIQAVGNQSLRTNSLCVDITGFPRPQLLFLIFMLKHIGVREFDVIYTEPKRYSQREATRFSSGSVLKTDQVQGYFGTNKAGRGRDLTIIAAGYDKSLLSRASQHSENSEVVQLIGFPSLSPDMYQENMIQVISSYDSFPDAPKENLIFAPAADPFEAANIVRKFIYKHRCLEVYDNVYICPISTKAHTLGVGLMHLLEFSERNVSIIYPFTESYFRETSVGISKVWCYRVEF